MAPRAGRAAARGVPNFYKLDVEPATSSSGMRPLGVVTEAAELGYSYA